MHSQLLCVGFQFSFMYLIAYASSRTLGTAYGYSPIRIGFVILSFGVGKFFLFFKTSKQTELPSIVLWVSGGVAGSVWGGRWSDYELTRLKTANDGKIYPEVSECVAAQRRTISFGRLLFMNVIISRCD